MSGFGSTPPFTVGLEEELLLVDDVTFALTPDAARTLSRMDAGERAGHEAYAAEIELRTSPSTSASSAVTELAELRLRALQAGATLLGVGVHPAAAFGDAVLVEEERYRRVDDEVRGIIRRTPECALHVHVGMPDEETAVAVYNRLRSHLPLLQALAANSPWWFGIDSGLASSRGALVSAYPGRGIPRPFLDARDWQAFVDRVLGAGDLADYTFLWSDLRIHPRHGTVELRELDAQSSLEDVAALAALARALAVEAAQRPQSPPEPSETLAWASFRAMRDGVEAQLLDDGRPVPLLAVLRRVLERVRPVARALGDDEALEGVLRIVETGGGAGRRRRAFARGGIRRQLEELAAETAGSGSRKAPLISYT
jgi:carboxylate-amine ligase